jgi:sugar-specific transcriptional regulator TrmB
MINDIESRLYGIGLTEGEIRTYLALLDLGPSTTGPIVKKSKISSSKVYEILDRLVKKGLVSFIIKSNVRYFEALDPGKIMDYLSEKEREIQEQRAMIKDAIPMLSARRKLKQEGEASRVFLGYQGIKSYFNEVFEGLNQGDERLVLGAKSGYSDLPKVVRFFQMINRKFASKGIRTKIIFNKELKGSERFRKMKLTQVRYLEHATPASIGIQGDNVDILLWTREKEVLFSIKSKEVADSYREFFKTMWQLAEK